METLLTGKAVSADELREFLMNHGASGNARKIAADLQTTALQVALTVVDNLTMFAERKEGPHFVIYLR